MTVEERLSKIEKDIENLRSAKDIIHTESLRKRVLEDIIHAGILDTTLTGINTTTDVAATPTSVSHASTFDKRVRVTIDGVPYYLGLYDI